MKLAFEVTMIVLAAACNSAPTVPFGESQTTVRSGAGTAQSGSLALQLTAPQHSVIGNAVPLTLTLTNTGNEPLDVTLGGRPPYDFVVRSPTGAEIWRWSLGKVVQMILEITTLKPGEQLRYAIEWSGTDAAGIPVSPGSYLVTGVLNLDPPERLETEPKQLVIASR